MFIVMQWILFVLPLVEGAVQLYNSEDSQSLELYDCIYNQDNFYCRRPTHPHRLARDQPVLQCHQHGKAHRFVDLRMRNISVDTILYEWNSSLEMVEAYSCYLHQPAGSTESDRKQLCECTTPSSFGKHCEYLLMAGETLAESAKRQIEMRSRNDDDFQMHGDIVCYQSFTCYSGRLCLDWREICDGVQQCMAGVDEENCDLLEFNECEEDEYRCMNGMCVPSEYFLDGIYDCLDLSDEKQTFNDDDCARQLSNAACDDRLCPPNAWSCGDGQCISDRLKFQRAKSFNAGCVSRRDQYFLCETNYYPLKTLTTGRCQSVDWNKESMVKNDTESDDYIGFVRCALVVQSDQPCIHLLNSTLAIRAYPRRAILAPYLVEYYNLTHDWFRKAPDWLEVNGTIRCQNSWKTVQIVLPYPKEFRLRDIEALICQTSAHGFESIDSRVQQYCHNQSHTFTRQPYRWIDACIDGWPPCLPVYRIGDGIRDCLNGRDETLQSLVPSTCSSIKQFRFRCSSTEATCFYANLLGNLQFNCLNDTDELWPKSGLLLSNIVCHAESSKDCPLLRDYIAMSWTSDSSHPWIPWSSSSKAISYRSYCDTFWNVGSSQDEDLQMCQKWWVCSSEQWRCATGQCIDQNWILDEEWDCFDASDEEALFASNVSVSVSNRNVVSFSSLAAGFRDRYSQQIFSTLCNLTIEWPCFRAGAFDAQGNVTSIRPCIEFAQIGDGHVDCLGGIDERNVMKHCNEATMLGNDFKCSSMDICIPFESICDTRCPNPADDETQCSAQASRIANCSDEQDFICLNHQCAKGGWCDLKQDCPFGEDEHSCPLLFKRGTLPPNLLYRKKKELSAHAAWTKMRLPFHPPETEQGTRRDANDATADSPIYVMCHRGLAIWTHNGTPVCFCPSQYYGEQCQYQSNRLSILFHLNLTHSIYVSSNRTTLVLKLLILLLFHNQSISTTEFHVRPAAEWNSFHKKVDHLVYSHSSERLRFREGRQENRSNLLAEHPYSLRVEIYELDGYRPPKLVGLWLYPIYFDFLPSFRLAKVLRMVTIDRSNDPCLSNPCRSSQVCHPLQNQPSAFICLCLNSSTGSNCAETHPLCLRDYCGTNALCKPDYRGLVAGNDLPYCICPFNAYGRRCQLSRNRCSANPCQNGGTCVPTSQLGDYQCLCKAQYLGEHCELNRQFVALMIGGSLPQHRAGVVQYLQIDFLTLELRLWHQEVHQQLPRSFFYIHGRHRAPELTLAKFYLDAEERIYILSIQRDQLSINLTVSIDEETLCLDLRPKKSRYLGKSHSYTAISPFEYHDLCARENGSLCLIDEYYLCICTSAPRRAECFIYDHSFDQCDRCLADGRCLKGDPSRSNDFLCLCHRCHDGILCQFSTEQLAFTLDSLLVEVSYDGQLLYFSVTLLIFIIGGVTNYASYVTFRRPKLNQLTVSSFLLVLSVLSQCSLFILLVEMVHIVFASSFSNGMCKLLSFLLSFLTRSSFWLTSWITVARVLLILFPFSSLLKKSRCALLIGALTLISVGAMHVHEILFYISVVDPDGQNVCASTIIAAVSTYDRVTVLIHYLVPFCIQIISITLLIVLAARSRFRTNQDQQNYSVLQFVKEQLNSQKESYLTPTIIVLSALPHSSLSFSFACTTIAVWQRHVLLLGYLLSNAPQLLGFVLFVLPSTSYRKEFQETQLARTRLFRWTLTHSRSPSYKR